MTTLRKNRTVRTSPTPPTSNSRTAHSGTGVSPVVRGSMTGDSGAGESGTGHSGRGDSGTGVSPVVRGSMTGETPVPLIKSILPIHPVPPVKSVAPIHHRRRALRGALVAVVAAVAASPGAIAQTCTPAWDSGFDLVVTPPAVGNPGLDGTVNAMVVFDDGTGPALYAGGFFTTAGGVSVSRIAKWDGSTWAPVGSGLDGADLALIVFDDGTGPALYAGGFITTAGGVSANRIAKWDGSTWTPLGSGMAATGFTPSVSALTVFDDGSGPALYAGGFFTTAGGVSANSVAKWNGSSWTPLGSGVSDTVLALVVFDDGSGPALYAAGEFTTAGGVSANSVAKWAGSTWTPLGSGMGGYVNALTVFDDGTGPALYAGGSFFLAGGVLASNMARWDGSSWAPLESGVSGPVDALTVFDDGTETALYAGGSFIMAGGVTVYGIAKWNGSSWAPLGIGVDGEVFAFTVFDDGAGPALFVGGSFNSASGVEANYIGKWNGSAWFDASGGGVDNAINVLKTVTTQNETELFAIGDFALTGGAVSNGVGRFDGQQWRTLGGGVNSGGSVNDLAVFDDGSGEALFAGGNFTSVGSVAASNIAKWDGQSWSPLGTGINAAVNALAVFDDGTGPALYAGGDFFEAGGVIVNHIARWDGQAWTALGQPGGGLGKGVVKDLAVFDDGTGASLYVGGAFTSAGGDPSIRFLARWDGAAWSALGTGVDATVTTMDVLDDGAGPALWARGAFTAAGGMAAAQIAKWDGLTWDPLAGGTSFSGVVNDLAVFDDGSGTAVFATGSFTLIGGVSVSRIAKWDGASWSPVGAIGLNGEGKTLATFNDGNGAALYVGGTFTEAGGLAARRITRWDGMGWSVLDLGIEGAGSGVAVNALAVFDGPTGQALYAGGSFEMSGGLPASNFARWNGCAGSTQADLNGDGVVDGADLASLLTQWGTNGSADLNGDGVVNGADLATLLTNWGPV